MALRYILLVSREPEELRMVAADAARRSGLLNVEVAGPFALLASSADETLPMPGGGVVIGTLFHRHGPPEPVTRLEPHVADAIRKSGGEHLIERYWGGYVAAFEAKNRARILRAPMGALPCYQLRRGALRLFASDPDVLCRAGLLEPRVDWAELGPHLYMRDLPCPETVLEGLSELLPGTAVTSSDGESHLEQCWSPWDYVAKGSGPGDNVAAEQLPRVVRQSISAWASCYSQILLSVSGGLDSSIVAATLAQRNRQFSCLTLATEDPSGDERHYARTIASHCGVELHERFYSLSDVDLDRSVVRHLPRPCGRIHDLAFRASVQALAGQQGCDAYFTGNGGDNVFYNSASARPIVDRYLAEGFGSGVIRTVRDVCAVTGAGAWQAFREARRVLRAAGRAYAWRREPLFLNPDLLEEECRQELTHPWLQAPADALPGKVGHIVMLLRMQHHLDGYDRECPFSLVNPLISQPIVETCLGIPTWVMCEGGVNRAAARAAFASALPPAIIERRTKAGPDSFIVTLIDKRLSEIRERLLEGELACRGMLDRDALSLSLSEATQRKASEYMRVMALLDTEAWIAHWANQPRATTDTALDARA